MKMKTRYQAEFAVGGFLVRGYSAGERASSVFVSNAEIASAPKLSREAIERLIALEAARERRAA